MYYESAPGNFSVNMEHHQEVLKRFYNVPDGIHRPEV